MVVVASKARVWPLTVRVMESKELGLGGEDGGVPVFPDGVEAEGAEAVGDGGGAALIGDAELAFGAGGIGLVVEFDAAAFDGEMQVVRACPRVAAGLGVAAGAHDGDPERSDGVAEGGGFARAHDDADFWEGEAEGGEGLDEGVIREIGEGMEAAGGRAEAGEGDGEGGFPAVFVEVLQVSGEAEGFETPVAETEERTDADATEAAEVAAFGAGEAPVEVFLGTGGVHDGIDVAVIGFLIDDETLGSGFDHALVFGRFHGADFDADGGDEGANGADAGFEVTVADEAGVFAGDEEDVAEALGDEVTGFGDDLVDGEGGAEDGVIAREAAVLAVVDALVGDVEGGKQAHGAAEVAPGDGAGFTDHGFELGRGFGL